MKAALLTIIWIAAVVGLCLAMGACSSRTYTPMQQLFDLLRMPAKPEQTGTEFPKLTALIPATESKTGSFTSNGSR